MTDFTPGAIITRESPLWDGDRPSWLRDDVRIQIRDPETGWYGTKEGGDMAYHKHEIEPHDDAIRLDASDIVYRCLEWNEAHPKKEPYFPHYGSDEAPADWDGAEVLGDDGDEYIGTCWQPGTGGIDIIGYRKRRPTTSLPEPAECACGLKPCPAAGLDATAPVHTSGYAETIEPKFRRGDRVEKISGSSWRGLVVGEYSTSLTPEGYAVESETETGSVQIYPAKALRLVAADPTPLDIAKAEHPDISAEIVERIAAIVKGEANV